MTGSVEVISDDIIDRVLAWHPFDATELGVRDHDDAVPDLSEDARATQRRELAQLRERLEAAGDGADPQDRITAAVARHELDGWEADLDARWEDFSVSAHKGGAHVPILDLIPKATVVSPAHAEAYVSRCRGLGGYLDRSIQRLRAGVTDGLTPPVRGVRAAVAQVDGYLGTPLADDPLLEPLGAAEDRHREAVSAAIRDDVRPAMARYRAVLIDEIEPHARSDERSGLVHLPEGEARYRRALARHTTTAMTPDEVHELGRGIVEDLADEYRELGGAVLGTADLASIFSRLRDDPDLRFGDADEVFDTAEAALRRAEDAVPDWFGRLPEAACEVRRIPLAEAPNTTIAYYLPPAQDGTRPGLYFVNTYQPATRTRFEAEVLAFHESVPGHHLQIAIQQELELPRIRRLAFVTAYVEGWGLYTERLCDEMGLYSDDRSRLGLLSFDSWRACRLVVDTGIHAFGWSRQQAIDYLVENSPQARNNIENEVDRYIAWPGQACAYMVGRREIRRLRRDAESRLGTRFDIRDFHDVVLTAGAVPLDVLASLVNGWTPGG